MDLDELAAAGHLNLAETWHRIGTTAPYDTRHDGRLVLTRSGLPIAFFNAAFVRGASTDDDADRLVEAAAEYFAERSLPWLLWVRQGADPTLSAACARAGLSEVGGPPAMVLPTIPTGSPVSVDGLQIGRATPDDLEDVRRVVATAFGMPIEVAVVVLGPALLAMDGVSVQVGRLDGEVVTTALVSTTGRTAGIHNVATLASVRGRGLGAAITWAAVLAGAEMGATHATLQSSPSGYPVYRRMGFADVGRYEQWEGPARIG